MRFRSGFESGITVFTERREVMGEGTARDSVGVGKVSFRFVVRGGFFTFR